MIEPNENFAIFLTLFMLSFSLPKFLLLFRAKLLFILFMLLIAFPVLSSKIKLHVSAFLGHLQTITTFAPLVLLVSFFFNCMSITNLSLVWEQGKVGVIWSRHLVIWSRNHEYSVLTRKDL